MGRRATRALRRGAPWAGWLALLLLLAPGCGPRFGNVSGTVTYQGKPLTGGTITFFDAANRTTSGEIKPDGTYTVSKVALGQARIAVATPMDIPFKKINEDVKMDVAAPKPSPIPVKYADADKSGLTCEVTAPDQKHDVTMD